MHRYFMIILLMLSPAAWAEQGNPSFFVLTYSPGSAWQSGAAFIDQPGMKAHIQYLTDLHNNDVVLMDGVLTDEPGEMLLLRTSSLDQAQQVAAQDPAVVSGVLVPRVSGWRVRMSSMRQYQRGVRPEQDPKAPFKLERINPGAPINLKNKGDL